MSCFEVTSVVDSLACGQASCNSNCAENVIRLNDLDLLEYAIFFFLPFFKIEFRQVSVSYVDNTQTVIHIKYRKNLFLANISRKARKQIITLI